MEGGILTRLPRRVSLTFRKASPHVPPAHALYLPPSIQELTLTLVSHCTLFSSCCGSCAHITHNVSELRHRGASQLANPTRQVQHHICRIQDLKIVATAEMQQGGEPMGLQVRGFPCHCRFPEECDSQLQKLPPTRALAAAIEQDQQKPLPQPAVRPLPTAEDEIGEEAGQQLEDLFVNDVYNTIAPHFNSTRQALPPSNDASLPASTPIHAPGSYMLYV